MAEPYWLNRLTFIKEFCIFRKLQWPLQGKRVIASPEPLQIIYLIDNSGKYEDPEKKRFPRIDPAAYFFSAA
jgi:hypothetical protein